MQTTSDTVRCHDSGCPEREQCQRWLQRADDTVWVGLSLFPYDLPLGEPCPLRVPVEGENTNA